jgi:hypothetical protein
MGPAMQLEQLNSTLDPQILIAGLNRVLSGDFPSLFCIPQVPSSDAHDPPLTAGFDPWKLDRGFHDRPVIL